MALDSYTPQIKSRPAETQHWHSLASDEVLAALNSMAESGLSEQEADRRLQQHGPNQLREAPPTTFLQLLWGQFNNFVVILLIVASVDLRRPGRLYRSRGHPGHRRSERHPGRRPGAARRAGTGCPAQAGLARSAYPARRLARSHPSPPGRAGRHGAPGSRQLRPRRCAPAGGESTCASKKPP